MRNSPELSLRFCAFVAIALALCAVPAPAQAAPYDAQLGSKIDAFLTGKNSPIAGNGTVFFTSGVTNGVDPRLVVAIAGAESSYGTMWVNCPMSGFNAWSYFYNGTCANSPFTSYAAGIQMVTRGMRKNLNRGLTTIPLIGARYCTSGCADWVKNVTDSYTAQLGDPADLSFASSLVDFESVTGAPSLFSMIQPPLTLGIATISGGQALSAATNLPADMSVTYGTSSLDLANCNQCLPAITIDFAQKVMNFSVWVLNGDTVTVTYTVEDDLGGMQTATYPANAQSGHGTVTLPSTGLRSVTVQSNSTTSWDFFIDNLRFAPM
jgi:hypothetical protein